MDIGVGNSASLQQGELLVCSLRRSLPSPYLLAMLITLSLHLQRHIEVLLPKSNCLWMSGGCETIQSNEPAIRIVHVGNGTHYDAIIPKVGGQGIGQNVRPQAMEEGGTTWSGSDIFSFSLSDDLETAIRNLEDGQGIEHIRNRISNIYDMKEELYEGTGESVSYCHFATTRPFGAWLASLAFARLPLDIIP